MAENLVIEAPDFDQIRKGDPKAIRDGIFLLWAVANDDIRKRILQVREAKDKTVGGVLTSAPAADQHNFDPGTGRIVLFTGSTAFNLTGIRGGQDGRILLLWNLGSGTITLKHNSGSSFAENRILTDTGGDVTVATGKVAVLGWLSSTWRKAGVI